MAPRGHSRSPAARSIRALRVYPDRRSQRDVTSTDFERIVRLSRDAPAWVPCAQTRGEGIFLRFDESALTAWEKRPDVRTREKVMTAAHEAWRADRRLPAGHWSSMRYVLLHTFAHAMIRELALECGYSAAGLAERIYARSGVQLMAGVLLYTAATQDGRAAYLQPTPRPSWIRKPLPKSSKHWKKPVPRLKTHSSSTSQATAP